MPYICCALDFSSGDTFTPICFNLEARFWMGLPEANLLLKGGPEAAGGQPPLRIPLLLSPGAGASEQARQAEGHGAGAAFCRQSPWRPHSQQQLPSPPS